MIFPILIFSTEANNSSCGMEKIWKMSMRKIIVEKHALKFTLGICDYNTEWCQTLHCLFLELSSDSKAIMIKQKLIKRDAQIFWLILLGWDWQTMEAQPASASILCLPQGNAENKNAANMRLFTFYAQEPCTNARACRITRKSYIYFWHEMLLIKAKCSRIKNKRKVLTIIFVGHVFVSHIGTYQGTFNARAHLQGGHVTSK